MSVRVLIDALGPKAAQRWVGVLRLSRFGAGSTHVTEDERAATLSLSARYLMSPRKPTGDFEVFRTLDGAIRLLAGGKPFFQAELEADGTNGEIPERGGAGGAAKSEPQLTLQGDDQTVSLSQPLLVPFPPVPEGARFLELGVELSVEGAVEASVDQNDRFDVVGHPSKEGGLREVQLNLNDQRRKPLDNVQVQLEAEGWSAKTTTDGEGVLKFEMPSRIRELTLIYGGQRHRMLFDKLEPLPSLRGIQARLKALGYGCEIDGMSGPATAAAVRAFQSDQGLRVDGDPGPITCDALAEAFGE
jgi:hypothetical protein